MRSVNKMPSLAVIDPCFFHHRLWAGVVLALQSRCSTWNTATRIRKTLEPNKRAQLCSICRAEARKPRGAVLVGDIAKSTEVPHLSASGSWPQRRGDATSGQSSFKPCQSPSRGNRKAGHPCVARASSCHRVCRKSIVSCQYQVADEQKCLVLSKLTFCPRCLVPTPQHSASCGTVG